MFVFIVPLTAKVIMETWPQPKFSSDRLVKMGMEHVTPSLQGTWFIHYIMAAPALVMKSGAMNPDRTAPLVAP